MKWETKQMIKQDMRERDVQYGIIVIIVFVLILIYNIIK